jgi:hypothetical protein
MVFVLYKVYNSEFNCVAVYEREEDAVNDRTNLILDSPVEELGSYRFEIVESHYFRYAEPPHTSYSEEDSSVDEEHYYELLTKSKHQSEEIVLLKEELLSAKNRYAHVVEEYSKDMFTVLLTVSGALTLFVMLSVGCLVL